MLQNEPGCQICEHILIIQFKILKFNSVCLFFRQMGGKRVSNMSFMDDLYVNSLVSDVILQSK